MSEKKTKDYNIAHIKRAMREYSGGDYRIAKDAPSYVSRAVEDYIKKLTLVAAEFSMNSGRCTIKAKDVQSAIKTIQSKD